MRALLSLALSALYPFILGACGSTEHASAADPIIGGTPALQYPEAVTVDMYRGTYRYGACSGALIAPRVVLTAGHCVAGFDHFYVLAPLANQQSANGSTAVTYDWSADEGTLSPARHDVGLIVLDRAIRLPKYPEVNRSLLADGTLTVSVGRVDSGSVSSTQLFMSAPVAVRDARYAGFPFDYTSTEVTQVGDSGGPVFLAEADVHRIVAVNSGSNGETQVVARVDLVADWISSELAMRAIGRSPLASGLVEVAIEP